MAQLSVLDTRAVEADSGPHIGFECAPEKEMAAHAKAHRTKLGMRHAGILDEVIERRAPVLIEVRHRSLCGVLHPARSSAIVKRDHRAGRLDAVIDFGGGGHETVTGQPNASPQR